MASVRAMANVPRQGQRQTMTGLDSYHQYRVQETRTDYDTAPEGTVPAPLTLTNSRPNAERPYHVRDPTSFSVPRPAPAPPTWAKRVSFLPWAPTAESRSSGIRNSFWGNRQRQPAAALPPPVSSSSRGTTAILPSNPPEEKRSPPPDSELRWRPTYLKRRILLCFAVFAAGLIAAVEGLLEISMQNTGIASSRRGLGYFWRYIAPVVLIFTSAAWSRVEFQAKFTAPWIRMTRGPATVERTLMLDYTSMFAPRAIFRAIRNRDWLVAVACFAGIIFKVLIIFSVALVLPAMTEVVDSFAEITITSEFVDDPARLETFGPLAHAAMLGLQSTNSSSYVNAASIIPFQSFGGTDLPNAAVLQATVDGFRGGLECETAELILDRTELLPGSLMNLTVTVSTASCNTTQVISSDLLRSTAPNNLPRLMMEAQQGACDNSTEIEDERMVVMAGTIFIDPDSVPDNLNDDNAVSVSGQFPQSTALLCRPTYTIARVQVTKNATDVQSLRLRNSGQGNVLDSVHPSDLMRTHFRLFDTEFSGGLPSAQSHYPLDQVVIDSNAIIDTILAKEVKDVGVPQLASLLQPRLLSRISMAYWQEYSALLARSSLLQESEPTTTTGSSIHVGERLFVRVVPAHLMAGLLGLVLIAIVAVVLLVPKMAILPRDPSTIIDMATLLSNSQPLLRSLRGAGAADEATIRDRLEGSAFSLGVEPRDKMPGPTDFKIKGENLAQAAASMPEFEHTGKWRLPIPLRLGAKLAVMLVVGGMIAGLEVMLRASISDSGIAPVSDRDYLHLLWTSGSAIVLITLSLYLGMADFVVRTLAPYAKLRAGGPLRRTIGLDFRDKCTPAIIWSALSTGNPTVLVTTITAFLATTLVIFSSTLFAVVPAPETRGIQLQAIDFFANTTAVATGDEAWPQGADVTLAALILNSNSSFPSFTFEDLSFPKLRLEGVDISEDFIIEVTLRALRPNLDCRLYPESMISTNFSDDTSDARMPMTIDVEAELCGSASSGPTSGLPQGISNATTMDPSALFGRATTRVDNPSQCSDLLYTWGQLSGADSDDPNVAFVSSMGCNETTESVSTVVRFRGSDLYIDPSAAPRVDPSTATPNDVALPELRYSLMPNISASGHALDPFFTYLVTSRNATSIALLQDRRLDTAGMVADSIVAQHKLIRTQNLSARMRRELTPEAQLPVSEDGETIGNGFDEGQEDGLPSFDGTLWGAGVSTSPKRLAADELTVRLLQGFLGAVLFGCITSLIFALLGGSVRKGQGMLPCHPGSIACVAALLADGNLFGFLPRGAEWMSKEDIDLAVTKSGGGSGFDLGWEAVRPADLKTNGRGGALSPTVGEDEFGIRVMRSAGWASPGATKDGEGESIVSAKVRSGKRWMLRIFRRDE